LYIPDLATRATRVIKGLHNTFDLDISDIAVEFTAETSNFITLIEK
jgi:hypothetical protein